MGILYAELVAFRIGHHYPGLVVALANLDAGSSQPFQAGNLCGLVLGSQVDMQAILARLPRTWPVVRDLGNRRLRHRYAVPWHHRRALRPQPSTARSRRRRAARISASGILSSSSAYSWVVSVEAWPKRRRRPRWAGQRSRVRRGPRHRDGSLLRVLVTAGRNFALGSAAVRGTAELGRTSRSGLIIGSPRFETVSWPSRREGRVSRNSVQTSVKIRVGPPLFRGEDVRLGADVGAHARGRRTASAELGDVVTTVFVDVLGLVLLSPGLAALVYRLAQIGGEDGAEGRDLGSATAIISLVVGVSMVAAFARHALRTRTAPPRSPALPSPLVRAGGDPDVRGAGDGASSVRVAHALGHRTKSGKARRLGWSPISFSAARISRRWPVVICSGGSSGW